MSSPIKSVRATVTSVKHNGWATATVTHRAINHDGGEVSSGDEIAVQPKFKTSVGDALRCIIKVDNRGRGWFAIAAQPHVERKSEVSWAPWQDGPNNLAQSLPDTHPGSDHAGIELQCWRCGNTVAEPGNVHNIRSTSIWTNAGDLAGIIVDEEIRQNRWKRCKIQNVRCARCKGNIGTYYKVPYYDSETGELKVGHPFPSIKIATNREMKGDEKPDCVTVLAGANPGVVKDSIAELEPSADWDDKRHFATGGRMDADTHRVQEKALKAVRQRREADERAREAKLEAERERAQSRHDAAQAQHRAEREAAARRDDQRAAETAALRQRHVAERQRAQLWPKRSAAPSGKPETRRHTASWPLALSSASAQRSDSASKRWLSARAWPNR
jgi:hypothetical protein